MSHGEESARPLGYVFAVADEPYCCWDFEQEGRTLEFLDGLDPSYFSTVASLVGDKLDGDDHIAASILLRLSYHQALETLFSLIGASAQAPCAVPAWIAQCRTEQLKDVIDRVQRGHTLLTQNGRQCVTFDDMSKQIHQFAWQDASGQQTTSGYAQFWDRLAAEFLDETARAEYNALKHGNRVSGGGFYVSIGTEEVPGVPPAPAEMRPLGGSRFGSTFFPTERAGTSKSHVRTRRTSLNWSAEAQRQRLPVIAMSINNIVGALRCHLGVDPTTVRFHRPDPHEMFDHLWHSDPGPMSASFDMVINTRPCDELTKAQLLALLEDRSRN